MFFRYLHGLVSCLFLQYFLINACALHIPSEPQTPASDWFVCGDGKYIPNRWRCDNDIDCVDGIDELNCPKRNCTDKQFTCDNGHCISQVWKCDGENDCSDGADEKDCNKQELISCKFEQFRCLGGNIPCIPKTWLCDSEADCTDGSDEINCSNNTSCADNQFSCGAPTFDCIYASWVCDGDKDCPNGIDEKNCTTSTTTTPQPINPILPTNGSACHEDGMFTCTNKKCIPYWWKCDKADDCGDNSDEVGCGVPLSTTIRPITIPPQYAVCQHTEFQCASGTCIPLAWVCDGSRDCSGGEDESQCKVGRYCTVKEFKCRMDGNCIDLEDVCNGRLDCLDGSDERGCSTNPTGPAGASCSVGYFRCDGSTCHPLAALCDGKHDCRDEFDEKNCTSVTRVYQVLLMGVDERSINQSSLLLYWWIPIPDKVKLEFLPSISKMGVNQFENKSWTEHTEYQFLNLLPFTKYNITIYVRLKDLNTVFPPAKYFIASTSEGIPSEPRNVIVEQRNRSHVLISWEKPVHPNGEIQNYEICWFPPEPPIKLRRLCDNSIFPIHLITGDFQHDHKYSFYVVALNRAHESKHSEVKSIVFDGELELDSVRHLIGTIQTNDSVSLAWEYSKAVDGYTVSVQAPYPYPQLPSQTTSTTRITVNNLAPGVNYTFKVNAYKKSLKGVKNSILRRTSGDPLPVVNKLEALVDGISVKLTWERPKDNRKVNWVYGVYYGLNVEDTLEKHRLTTNDTAVTITQLQACEKYIFTVGIVGPLGVGSTSNNPRDVMTSLNKKAPPKRLTVVQPPEEHLAMLVKWSASCPVLDEPVGYIVTITEKNTNKIIHYTVPNTTEVELSLKFRITYGGVYEVKVSTDVVGAINTLPVIYYALPILPPYAVRVFSVDNGIYIVFWQQREIPPEVESYKYEVLVSEGAMLNETTAQRFESLKPPFVYNGTSHMYTFAVQLVTNSGYRSVMSLGVSRSTYSVQEAEKKIISRNTTD